MEQQETVIVTPSGRFAAKRWGCEQGSPLIALHGWLDNAASFEAARTLVTRALESCEGGVTWRSDPRVRSSSPQRFTEAQVQAFLRRIEAPTLVMLNERGLVLRCPQMVEQASCLGDARIVRLPGGHHAHMDHPKEVADVVNDFLRRPR